MPSELLSVIREEIDARLRKLAPAAAEHERLTAVVQALEAEARAAPTPVDIPPAQAAGTMSRPSRSRASRSPVARPGASRPRAARSRASQPRAPRAAATRSAPPARTPARTPVPRGPSPAARAPRPKTPSAKAPRRRARERPADTVGGKAIVAALEHGSHTVAELVIVTALPAPEIRASARALLQGGAIVKTAREGKAAYALPGLGD